MYPYFDLYPALVILAPQEGRAVQDACRGDLTTPAPLTPVIIRRDRNTRVELRTPGFRSLGKRPARNSKTHVQLHTEVFQDGVVWTPSGCMQRAVQHADVGDLATPHIITRSTRRTHMELHASVFRALGKRPAQSSKTHVQLHTEVFQDGIVWTPSGYVQDITYLTRRKPGDIPVRESRRRPSQDNSAAHIPRSRSGTNTPQSPDKVVFPLTQPPALPPISPLRVRSPGISSPPSPAVSETPRPRVSSPSISTYTHKRTTSSRLTQAVKSIMPGLQRRNSSTSAAPESSPPADNKERVNNHQSPARFLSLADRRSSVVPPLPHINTSTSEFLTRAPPSSQRKESLVFQRARTYEQAIGAPLRDKIPLAEDL